MNKRLSNRPEALVPRHSVDSLYQELLRRGIEYFFPHMRLGVLGKASRDPVFLCRAKKGRIEFQWLGVRYSLASTPPMSEHQIRLVRAVGRTLATRYEALWDTTMIAENFQLFRGLPEDQFVSAFLDPDPYTNIETLSRLSDRVGAAIEVLRVSGLTTYENRRITTGAFVIGRVPDACHISPDTPSDAPHYDLALTQTKSFYHLCDGLRTLALVDLPGRLADLIDVGEWVEPFRGLTTPVPVPSRYEAHCRATMCGGHICLVLTPAGEIKVFSEGNQMFRFSDGKWWLSDMEWKYRIWEQAIGDRKLAGCLFQVAVNMAEDRRGGLIIVLDDRESIRHLVRHQDMLESTGVPEWKSSPTQQGFHYLVHEKRALDIAPSLIESLANIDGAILLSADSTILAFGAIIQPLSEMSAALPTEGGRTTAAILASRYGKALKISEDGGVSFYRDTQRIWEI